MGDQGVAPDVANDTLATTKDHALESRHLQVVGTHRAADNLHGGGATTIVGKVLDRMRGRIAVEITHGGQSAAAVDVAHHSYRFCTSVRNGLECVMSSKGSSICHSEATHHHLGVGGNDTSIDINQRTITATEDIAGILYQLAFIVDSTHGAVDQFDQRTSDGGVEGTILGDVAAAIDIVERQGACRTPGIVHDHRNVTFDIAVLVTAAIDRADGAAMDDDGDIAAGAIQ